MAVTICPECGGKASNTLSACPHCGFRLNTQSSLPPPVAQDTTHATSHGVQITPLSCPQCGAVLTETGNAELFKCRHCGTPSLIRRSVPVATAGQLRSVAPLRKAIRIVPEFEVDANLWRGKFLGVFPNSQGGKLILTDQEVVFLPHRFNAGPLEKCSIPIREVGRMWQSGLNNFHVQRTNGDEMVFVLWDASEVESQIEARRQQLGVDR